MRKKIDSFFVPGIPATAGSKQGFYNKKLKRVIMAPDNKRQKPWMAMVQAAAADHVNGGKPIIEPVFLGLEFYLPRPKSHFGTGKNAGTVKASAPLFPTTKPDLTKMVRAVEDALTGIIWKDDSQVCGNGCYKFYAAQTPGVRISVRVLAA